MSTRVRSTIFAGAAFAALGLAPQAFAQNFPDGGFKVIDLTGGMQPTVGEIGVLCGFPPRASVEFGNIKPNDSVLVETTTETILGQTVEFSARVNINDNDSINITDISTDPSSLVISAQQIDGAEDSGGVLRPAFDAAMVKGGNDISVICAFQRTFVENIELPGKIQTVMIVWADPVCPVAQDDLTPGQCDAWNPDLVGLCSTITKLEAENPANKFKVHALIGQQLGLASAVSACGFGPFATGRCRQLGDFVDKCVAGGSTFVSIEGINEVTTSGSPLEIVSCQDTFDFVTTTIKPTGVKVTCWKW